MKLAAGRILLILAVLLGGASAARAALPSAPTLSLTAAPPGRTTDQTAAFAFTTGGVVTRLSCSLDRHRVRCAPTAVTFNRLSFAKHTFTVTATNPSTRTSVSWRWTVVRPPRPAVKFTAAPPGHTYLRTAAFTWADTGVIARTSCRLDRRRVACAATAASLAGVAVGKHTFSVTVTGPGGRARANWRWTVKSHRAPKPKTRGLVLKAGSPLPLHYHSSATGTVVVRFYSATQRKTYKVRVAIHRGAGVVDIPTTSLALGIYHVSATLAGASQTISGYITLV